MSRRAFRIVKAKLAGSAFDGQGARQFGGRWNSPGVAVVYAAGTASLAMLEMLVHLRSSQLLESYVLIEVEFDDALIKVVDGKSLPPTWRSSPPPTAAQQIGNNWVASASSAVLQVPSAIVPSEWNYLLNPSHAKFSKFRIRKPEPVKFDPRLKG